MNANKLTEIRALIDTQGRGVSDTPTLFDAMRVLLPVVEAAEEWYRLGKTHMQYTGIVTEADLARGRLYRAIEALTGE